MSPESSPVELNQRMAAAGMPVSQSSFKIRIARHPLAAFFIIAYAGTWLFHLPMVLGKHGLGIFGYEVPFPLYAGLFLVSSFTGPTLAAFVVTAALDGRVGCRRLFSRYFQWRVGFRWYPLVLLGYPAIYLLAATPWLGLSPFRAILGGWSAFFTTYLPAILIFPALVTWGEEPGWRGFALTRMQERYSPLVSTLTVGLMHGLWHLPIFLIVSGPVALGPFNFGRFAINTLGIVAISVTWTWVFNSAGQSILVAVMVHACGNAAPALMSKVIPDYPEQAGVVALAIFAGLALVIIAATKGRLGYRPAAD